MSALDGLSTPTEIADRIKAIGLKGAFITDHAVIAGWRPFAKAMAKEDLFAGFGVECYQTALGSRKEKPRKGRDQAHLILLAKNERGLQNIMNISYEANRDGFFYVPRVDWELLEKYREGVICTSSCVAGLTAGGVVDDEWQNIYKFQKVFGEDYFIELHTYAKDKPMNLGHDVETTQAEVNLGLIDAAKQLGIPMVYANDAHYACKGDYPYHEVLLAMQMGKNLEDPNRMSHPESCLHIMTEATVRKSLSYLPESIVDEAIANSDLIAERCQASLPVPGKHLPVFVPQDVSRVGMSNNELLISLVEEGLAARFPEITDEIEERALMELEVIINAGLTDYFLITHDMCMWSDSQGIGRGPGRGSVGGSIVAYALWITDIDPLKYGLYFERFYNAGRDEGLPDIDIDFSAKRRHEVHEYLKSRYGEYNVIPIGTQIRLKPKAVIDKLVTAFGVDRGDAVQIKKILETVPDIEIISADQVGWRMAPGINVAVLEEVVYEDGEQKIVPSPVAKLLEQYIRRYPDMFDVAEKFGGRLSGYGIHASAVVISDVDIRTELPVMFRADKKVLATQIEMREVESLGFPKFDLLGLKNIDILDAVYPPVVPKEGSLTTRMRNLGIDWDAIDWDNQPEGMWELLDKGFTLGFFQVEDGNAKNIAKKMQCRSIEDLAALVSLNRPGPLRSGAVSTFLDVRAGEAKPEYTHPILEPILDLTAGVFLYQEQVIKYFGAIGYNLKEADAIRKMLGKKLIVKMSEEHPTYMAKALNFMDEDTAQKIWDDVLEFSLYSFNKSHAIGYAMILARTMYAKYHEAVKDYMALINDADDVSTIGSYALEARRMGIEVFGPDINHSDKTVSEVDGNIYFGLVEVKGVGAEAARWIMDNRPYASHAEFLEKHTAAQKAHDELKKQGKAPLKSPKQVVRANVIQALYDAGAFDNVGERQDIDIFAKAEHQQALLGVIINDPANILVEQNIHRLPELNSYNDVDDMLYLNDLVMVPGRVCEVRKTTVKRGRTAGKEMAHFYIQWEGAKLRVTAWPDTYAGYKNHLIKENAVGVFGLRVKESGLILEQGTKLSAVQ
jgi:DNA polymerase-3 subunit alpha